MEAGFWSNVARGLFATIDSAIYSLISVIYKLIEELASVNIFNSGTIDELAGRVYTFIGIIMVFKVTFSLINYLVNPDSITDKNTGAGNVAKNVVITLFLIILTPYAFDFLYRAQNAILNDDIIPKVILGGNIGSGTDFTMDVEQCGSSAFTIEDRGNYVSMVAFRPFYRLNKDAKDFSTIKDGYCHEESVKALLKPELYKADDQSVGYGTYMIDYSFLLSTAAGIVILILLLTTSMEIALRAIKLGFLELIAPIPIISYIDPKSGKDGIFKKWFNEVIKTWANLFIRLAVIYFAIYIISLADAAVNNLSDQNLKMWALLFIVIGALMFAKQFPKLIEDIFGIKLDGLSLNPIKKFKEQALGGETLAKLPGKAASDLTARGMSAIGSVKNRKNAKAGFEKDMAAAKLKDRAALNQKLIELRNQKTNGIITADEWRTKALEAKKSSVENQNAVQQAYDKKFSNSHPIMAGIAANQRAGHQAFSMDPKSIKDIIKNASASAEKAAKMRTYTDNYKAMDRLQNVLTNWGDIKYKGGTADLIDSNIKELKDRLTSVTNALDSLRQAQGMFPAGTFAYNTSTGEIGLAQGITNPAASENIKQTKELEQTMKDLNSEIKKQTKILEQQKEINK